MKYYRVSESMLKDLLYRGHVLEALENWGVDNWEGYGVAQNEYLKDCSVIDETKYENLEDVVDADIATFQECKCEAENKNVLDTMIKCLDNVFEK